MYKPFGRNTFSRQEHFKKNPKKNVSCKRRVHSVHGGITLEYILVTTFSIVATMTALGFMKKIISTKLGAITQELQIEEKDHASFFN